jgi:uroporphyrinogen decarboxylase
MMTQRERYLAVTQFQPHDRIPFDPGDARAPTVEAWRSQGLPEGVDYLQYLLQELGIAAEACTGLVELPRMHRMIPEFEEKVLEKRERTLVVQDWKGNVCEISDEYDVSWLRNPLGFVSRRWIRCPVETREDFERIKSRYDVHSPERFPRELVEACRAYKDRDFPLQLHIDGPWFQMREWLGFEGLCFMLYDDPVLVNSMVEFYDSFMSELLVMAFQLVVPDVLCITEDMGYKMHSMISPKMARRYLAPCWKHASDIAMEAGVPLRNVDSDGNMHEMLPIWMESGVNMCEPIEIAAGNDLARMRKESGMGMALHGGIDKRAMAAGGSVLQQEMARIHPVVGEGGYIPSCDHAVPPDVSWPNFLEYGKLLAKETGWLK